MGRVALRLSLALWLLPALMAAETGFEAVFVDRTLRVDLHHVGHATEEVFAVDRLILEGPWAGPRGRGLVDARPQGRYLARLKDPGSGATVWAHPWDSYFGEYRTTAPAGRGVRRTFHESLRLPLPRRPMDLQVEVRERGATRTLLVAPIDPGDLFVVREEARPALVVESHPCSPAPRCVDLVLVGEGYTAAEESAFRADLSRFTAVLVRQEPFALLRDRLAVRGVLVPSPESGCDEPSRGVWRRSAVGASFDALGSERYLLTEDNRALHDAAAAALYDLIIVMVNHRRYGGGGIFNFYSTFTAHNQWSEYVFVHELGHALAGLADEYYTSSVAYNDLYPPGVEPAEPNITALLDPAALKWQALVAPSIPLPTPWAKEGFDALDRAYQAQREALNRRIAEAMRAHAPEADVAALIDEGERLSVDHARAVDAYLAGSPGHGVVGAFEGAGYSSTGLYRPALDCIMFSKGLKPFCPVCQGAIRATVELLTD